MRRILSVVSVAAVFGFSSVMGYAQLAATPWPMFHHDARHTGQSEYAGPSVPVFAWSYRLCGNGWMSRDSCPALWSDGRVYVGSPDNNLYSFSSIGGLVWSYQTYSAVGSSPALGSDGRVYVGVYSHTGRFTDYGSFDSFNSSGGLAWSYDFYSGVDYSPALGSDGSVYLCHDNYVYCFNSSGGLVWTVLNSSSGSDPALGSDGSVCVGSYYGFNSFNSS